MSLPYRILAVVLVSIAVSGCNSDSRPVNTDTTHTHNLIRDNDTLCLIGDSGTGDAVQKAVAAAMQTVNCSQIRILGDVVYPSGIESAYDPELDERLLQPYRYFFDRNIPAYLILGNHDHKKNSAAWFGVAARHPLIRFPNYYYSENWDGICFFSLDTSYYEKIYFAHKRSAQTEWLRAALTRHAPSCRFSIALGHHPYRSSGSHGNAQLLLDWFMEDELIGRIDLYLSGHDHHLSDEGEADGTRLLISGSAGLIYPLKTRSADHRFSVSSPGFITLEFSRDDSGNTLATYKIHTLRPDGKGGYTDLKVAWQDRIRGRGIR